MGAELLLAGGDSPEGAAAYCDGLEWGGFSDWRLPDIKVLASLSDSRTEATAIDLFAFPATPPGWFWSSTPYVLHPDYLWFFDFGDGHAKVADRYYGHALRCVR